MQGVVYIGLTQKLILTIFSKTVIKLFTSKFIVVG